MLVNKYIFNKIKKEVDDSVIKKLGPKINKKKIAYIHLKHFLQDVLLGKFNDTKQPKEYYNKKSL